MSGQVHQYEQINVLCLQGDKGNPGPEGLPGASGSPGNEGPVGLTGGPGQSGPNVSFAPVLVLTLQLPIFRHHLLLCIFV